MAEAGVLRPKPRPAQLDDRDWLVRRYAVDGDTTIATELGCSEATVRRARARLGIPSRPSGRRHGSALHLATTPSLRVRQDTFVLLGERFHEDQRHRVPATRETLIAACKGWLDAEHHHDRQASQDALLSIASAALLIHQHQTKLKAA